MRRSPASSSEQAAAVLLAAGACRWRASCSPALVGRRMGDAAVDHRGRRPSSSATAIATYLAFQALSRRLRRARHRVHALHVDPGRRPPSVEAGFLVDNLTAVMLIVVTWIGALVHVYTIGYMSHDPGGGASSPTSTSSCSACCCSSWRTATSCCSRPGSWWACSSYLLIGFWYHAARAGAGLARRRSSSTASPTRASSRHHGVFLHHGHR